MLLFQRAFRKTDNSSLHKPSRAVTPLEPQLQSHGNNYKNGPAFPVSGEHTGTSSHGTARSSAARAAVSALPGSPGQPLHAASQRDPGAGASGRAARSRYREVGSASPSPLRSPETAALWRLRSLRFKKVAKEWEPSPRAETPALSRACPEPLASAGARAGPFATGGSLPLPTPGGGLLGSASSRDRRSPGTAAPRPRSRKERGSGQPAYPSAAPCSGSPGSACGSARGRELLSGNSSVGQRRRLGEGGGASPSGGGRGLRGLLSSPLSFLFSRLPFPCSYFGSSCGGGRSLKSTLPPSFPVRRRWGRPQGDEAAAAAANGVAAGEEALPLNFPAGFLPPLPLILQPRAPLSPWQLRSPSLPAPLLTQTAVTHPRSPPSPPFPPPGWFKTPPFPPSPAFS